MFQSADNKPIKLKDLTKLEDLDSDEDGLAFLKLLNSSRKSLRDGKSRKILDSTNIKFKIIWILFRANFTRSDGGDEQQQRRQHRHQGASLHTTSHSVEHRLYALSSRRTSIGKRSKNIEMVTVIWDKSELFEFAFNLSNLP